MLSLHDQQLLAVSGSIALLSIFDFFLPLQAANKLKKMVAEGDRKLYETKYLSKARSCDIVYDAVELEFLRERSRSSFDGMMAMIEVYTHLTCRGRSLTRLACASMNVTYRIPRQK